MNKTENKKGDQIKLTGKDSTALAQFKKRFFTPIEQNMERLLKYEVQKKDLVAVDVNSGPMYMRDFNKAFDILSILIAKTDEEYEGAVAERKNEEAKAVLERATEYFEQNDILHNGIKDSVSLRETYMKRDPKYLEARDKENFLKAFLKYLQNMQDSFKMAHDDAKKIYDKVANNSGGTYTGIPSGGKKQNHNY